MRHSGGWFVVLSALALACGGDAMPMTDDAGATCSESCDDGQFCNGTERCEPGAEGADARGCVAGAPPCAAELCEEDERRCRTSECDEPDADGDGAAALACGGDDCDDADADVGPGRREVCDAEGVDEDCDPTTLGPDDDGDGFQDASCANVQSDGNLLFGDDCDDRRTDVRPSADEICDDRDNDCDDGVDEGVLETFFRDLDGDGFGDTAQTRQACARPEGYVLTPGDCDDRNQHANDEDAAEACDGFDNDCDDEVDEGVLVRCWVDGDRDGWALASASSTQECFGCPSGTTAREPVTGAIDCDDLDALENPGGTEVCDDQRRDEDCNGIANPRTLCDCDPGSTRSCADGGWRGNCAAGLQTCSGAGSWGTCSIAPTTEVCGGGDQNCNGMADDTDATDRAFTYADADGDGVGDPSTGALRCPASGRVVRGDDCDDGDALRSPLLTEVCDASNRDEDCDGLANDADPSTTGRSRFYADRDGDTFGNAAEPYDTCSSSPPAPFTATNASDCDDCRSDVRPGGTERCDGADNDCSGSVDDGGVCTARTSCGIYDRCDCFVAYRNATDYYLFCPVTQTQADARAACTAMGTKLVALEDLEETDWVAAQARTYEWRCVRIGQFCAFETLWTDGIARGGSCIPVGWGFPSWDGFTRSCAYQTRWVPGAPSGTTGYGVTLEVAASAWNTRLNTDTRHYVCEGRVTPTPVCM
jgi:hypothetical protein